ncbi:MAG: hypothetical protein WB676_21535 [Bryobacteraceae bacterium]
MKNFSQTLGLAPFGWRLDLYDARPRPNARIEPDAFAHDGDECQKMTQHQWKQRITVVRKGNPSEPIIEQISFDSTGQM